MDPFVPVQNLVQIGLEFLKYLLRQLNLKRGADFFESKDLLLGMLKFDMFHVKHLRVSVNGLNGWNG